MKALRLPIRVSTVTYWFASAAHAILLRSCPAVALLGERRSPPGRGLVAAGCPAPASRAWTRVGSLRSSGDPSCASAPFQDPGRTDVPSPFDGHAGAAPAMRTAKASAMADFGANPQLRHSLPYASRVMLPDTCKACFRLAGCAFAGRDSNPLNRYERFQFGLTIILLSCSPDATAYRCAHAGYELWARFPAAAAHSPSAPSA
jgi:hypothetical protein